MVGPPDLNSQTTHTTILRPTLALAWPNSPSPIPYHPQIEPRPSSCVTHDISASLQTPQTAAIINHMGTPIPEPPEIGDDCVVCGYYLWDPGETPKFMKVTFSGIVKCDWALWDAPNGEWILTQLPDTPCTWQYRNSKYSITVQLTVDRTTVTATYSVHTGQFYFVGQTELMCQTACDSNITQCNEVVSIGKLGSCVMDWMNDYLD